MSKFELIDTPGLSRSTVDRREPLRNDDDHLASSWATAKILLVDKTGRTAVTADGTSLVLFDATEFASRPPTGAVLLGEQDGTVFWALRTQSEHAAAGDTGWEVWQPPAGDQMQWLDLRGVGGLLNDMHAGLVVTAVATMNWHARAGFCARDGSPVRFVKSGWASRCTQCDHEEYPRTDPAIICLVHDGDGENGARVLLARQPVWPAGRYSVLAGFVEAGEALESTVHREILEEVGVPVREVRYLGSQPWPFPRSIMLGFTAVADPDLPLVPQDGEIESARWVTREHLRRALAADGGEVDGIALPGSSSIAWAMLNSWAATQ